MEDDMIYTIKEIYDWAVKNGYENYILLRGDEGYFINVNEIYIDEKDKNIYL